MAPEVTFHVDGRSVSRAEFNCLFDTLRQSGGWYCEKMSTGGRTGWEATDPQGVKYRYTATTESGSHTKELERLP